MNWSPVYTLLLSLTSPKVNAESRTNFKGIPELTELNTTAGEKRFVYFHEQIVAIVDLTRRNTLIRCELIETYEPDELEDVLTDLSEYKIQKLFFNQTIKLMEKCDALDDNVITPKNPMNNILLTDIFRGIFPGTKWCGFGDIAEDYHDLGQNVNLDRCCRMHDLCPVKIRANKMRYNLQNPFVYTKSHCTCDDSFYACLKNVDDPAARLLGGIYFNQAERSCLSESPGDNITLELTHKKRAF